MDDALWIMPAWVAVGVSFLQNYGPNSPNTRRYHIRAIVDEDMVVVRSWSARRGWQYEVLSVTYFTMRSDRITNIKKSKVAA
jgi:hypothetical protein